MYQLRSSKGWDVKSEGHFPKSESIHKEPCLKEKRKGEKELSSADFVVF